MKIQKQLNRHDPKNGIYGDCHRTAIACVLNMDAVDVPHFMDGLHNEPGDSAHEAAEQWLNERGIATITMAFDGKTPLSDILSTVANVNTRSRPVYILGGESCNGVNHSVVCCDGEIVCDPSIDNSGIIGPCDDGFYWLTFFGVLTATAKPLVTKHRPDPELDHTLSVVSDALNATGE